MMALDPFKSCTQPMLDIDQIWSDNDPGSKIWERELAKLIKFKTQVKLDNAFWNVDYVASKGLTPGLRGYQQLKVM